MDNKRINKYAYGFGLCRGFIYNLCFKNDIPGVEIKDWRKFKTYLDEQVKLREDLMEEYYVQEKNKI